VALELGYYQVPKKMTTKELARKHKVPRTTFEEHLRKAESKVLLTLALYIILYAQSPKELEKATPQLLAR